MDEWEYFWILSLSPLPTPRSFLLAFKHAKVDSIFEKIPLAIHSPVLHSVLRILDSR
jgi:hypothetical protein